MIYRKFLIFSILVFFSVIHLSAFELVTELTKLPDLDYKFPVNYVIRENGAKIVLENPKLYSTDSIVHNQTKKIWAINFHLTTDYNGVDLIYEAGNKILTKKDIWKDIESKTIRAGIADESDLNRLFFRVESIQENQLRCHLTITNNSKLPNPPEKDFIVYFLIRSNGIQLSLKNMRGLDRTK